MKVKTEQHLNKWRSVFKILPVKTEDGFTVWMERVYKMETDDIGNPVKYHTNPLRDMFAKLDKTVSRFLEEGTEMNDEIREWSSRTPMPKVKPPLTKGKMLRGNPPPPESRGNRPPPPPAPPKRRADVEIPKVPLGRFKIPKYEDEVCPKCGTTDCYKGPVKFDISGAGVLHVKSSDILKSCKGRQQLKALEKINIGKKRNGSTGPK